MSDRPGEARNHPASAGNPFDAERGKGSQHLDQRWAAAIACARRQSWILSTDQLLALGFSYREIEQLVRRGHLHRLHRGVYALGHRDLRPKGHQLAALMAGGSTAFLSGWGAAAVCGLRPFSERELELTVVADHTPKRPGLIIHRTASPPVKGEVVTRFGLRYSSVPRLLIELAHRETPAEVKRMIDLSLQKRILNLNSMDAALDRHAGEPGVAALRRTALARYLDRADRSSDLEKAFDSDHRAYHADIPDPEKNIYLGRWEIDRFWPAHQVALELDGRPYHLRVQEMERDRIKDAELQLMGIKPLRFTDLQYGDDPGWCFNTLRSFLELDARRAA